jgi:hypothetical protein
MSSSKVEMDKVVLCAIGRQMSELRSSFNNLTDTLNIMVKDRMLLEAEIEKLNKYLEKNINVSTSKKAEG